MTYDVEGVWPWSGETQAHGEDGLAEDEAQEEEEEEEEEEEGACSPGPDRKEAGCRHTGRCPAWSRKDGRTPT